MNLFGTIEPLLLASDQCMQLWAGAENELDLDWISGFIDGLLFVLFKGVSGGRGLISTSFQRIHNHPIALERESILF
jgi:hypothetical protein